jgi:hypothetical protein
MSGMSCFESSAAWEGEMTQYNDPDIFVFLDECAVDNITGQCMQEGLIVVSLVAAVPSSSVGSDTLFSQHSVEWAKR